MNSDFRLSIGYFRHPKIQKLKRRLGSDGVLAHAQLLSFAAQERPTGELTNMDPDDIALACDYAGDIDLLIAAWIELRLLDKGQTGLLSLHDWAEHNPWAVTAPERSEAGRKGAEARWAKNREGKTGGIKDGSGGTGKSADGKSEDAAKPEGNAEKPVIAESAVPSADESTALLCGSHKSALPVASSRNAPLPSYPLPSYPLPSYPSVSQRSDSEATTTSLPSGDAAPPSAESQYSAEKLPPDDNRPAATESVPENKDGPEREVVVASVLQNLQDIGVSDNIALLLTQRKSAEAVQKQIAWLPQRIRDKENTAKPVKDPVALLVKAIEEGWAVPASYSQAKQREAEATRRRSVSAQRNREAKEREQAEAEIREAGAATLQAAWDALPPEKRQQVTDEATARFRQQFSFHVPALEKAGDPLKMPIGALRNWENLRDAVLLERSA